MTELQGWILIYLIIGFAPVTHAPTFSVQEKWIAGLLWPLALISGFFL